MRNGGSPPEQNEAVSAIRPGPLSILSIDRLLCASVQEGSVFDVSQYQASPTVEVMVYDFGAVTITYRFSLDGPFDRLLELSESLYENERLLTESRARVEQLIQALGPAIERPCIAEEVEDYIMFSIESHVPENPPLWTTNESDLAQILRAERTPFSEQEVADAVSCRISFGREDAAVIDWHSAVLFGKEMDDVRAVLEFANVELLEMRMLDEQLDRALDEGYEALSRKPRLLSLTGLPRKRHDAHCTASSRQRLDFRTRHEHLEAAGRSVPRARLSARLAALPFGSMGREHPSQTPDPGKHLRQDVGPSRYQTDGGA